jgi:hypothetical protein
MRPTPQPSAEVRDSVIYWFVVLEISRDRGDYSLAAAADRELRRLGVRVTRTRTAARKASRQEAANASG